MPQELIGVGGGYGKRMVAQIDYMRIKIVPKITLQGMAVGVKIKHAW